MVLVTGEPGIGKSRLLHDAAGEAVRQGFSLAAGAAEELGRMVPFCALRGAFSELSAKLSRDLLPAPAWWINHVQGDLEQRAAAAPVLVCLDDLHWAGPSTLAALRTLPLELKRRPVAWLLARSSTPQPDIEYLFNLLRREGAAHITLGALSDDTVAALLEDAFGAPPGGALLAVARDAAGNPGLLTELIRGLREDNAVRTDRGYAVLVSGGLPRRMSRVGRERLSGLSKRARQMLVTATVLGSSFRLDDVAEMLSETPAALLPTIEEAMDAGILTAAEQAFSFQHPLLHRAVHEAIPQSSRRGLHRQYGQALLRRGESPAVAARHLLQAAHRADPASLSDLDDAVLRMGSQAPQTAAELALRAVELTRPANPQALWRLVAAVEALAAAGRVDPVAQIARDALAKPLPVTAEARLRCALSSALRARGQASDAHAEARIVLAKPRLPNELRDRALTAQLQALAGLHDEFGDPVARAVLAAPGEHDGHAVVAAHVTRAVMAWDKGRVGEALGLLRDAARHGSGISRDARHDQPLLALAASLIDLRHLAEAESILRAVDDETWRGIPAQAALSMLRARIHVANGRLGEAAADGQTALGVAESLGAHAYASVVRSVLGVIELRRGDITAAATEVAAGPVPMPHYPALYARSETVMAGAEIREARGGPAAVVGRVGQICTDLRVRPGYLLGAPTTAAWLVRTALAAGEPELAAVAADTADALATDNPGYPAIAAAAVHSRGLADRDPVRLCHASAQHTDPWGRASAAEDLGVLHARRSDSDEAVHHLTRALRGYQAMGAASDTERVRGRLREFGVRRRYRAHAGERPTSGWQSLTETERVVSEQIAQGLNNQQVASQMYISVHTVAFHVRQIFRKLNVGSRVELARIAMQQVQ